MLIRAGWALFFGCLISVLADTAFAQDCGPICSRPGHYVLCSDSFDDSMAVGGSFQLNYNEKDATFDRLCVGYVAPAATYNLRGAYALLTAGGLASFCLELFEESFAGAPTRPIAAGVNAQCFNAGLSVSVGWVEFALSANATYTNLTDDPRICFFDQAGASQRHVLFDADGAAGHNTVFLNPLSTPGWALATARGIPGDFILRPIVQLADLTPWEPGGICAGGSPDAGPADLGSLADGGDAGNGPDVGPIDGGVDADVGVDDDVGVQQDAAESPDAGPGADASGETDAQTPGPDASATDSGGFDAGGTESDAGLPGEAPTIATITPDQGLNDRETDVLVTGTGFVSGASLKIGPILAVSVSVPGTTTLLAKVPPGIIPGVYDVTVQNPDQQAAVLAQAFTVIDASGTGNLPEDDCGCQVADSRSTPTGVLALLLLGLALRARRHRLRTVPVNARLARRRKTS